jgi:hypothetical protein
VAVAREDKGAWTFMSGVLLRDFFREAGSFCQVRKPRWWNACASEGETRHGQTERR